MGQEAKQMRAYCQQLMLELRDPKNAPAVKLETMVTMLDQIQKRLTLLEGATLQSLEEEAQK